MFSVKLLSDLKLRAFYWVKETGDFIHIATQSKNKTKVSTTIHTVKSVHVFLLFLFFRISSESTAHSVFHPSFKSQLQLT